MKIYVSGKITGLPYYQVQKKFAWHSEFLRLKGYDVVNPLDVSEFIEGKKWCDYMVDCIRALLTCETIYMLNDWGQSKGARVEYAIAKELGLKIIFHNEFNSK